MIDSRTLALPVAVPLSVCLSVCVALTWHSRAQHDCNGGHGCAGHSVGLWRLDRDAIHCRAGRIQTRIETGIGGRALAAALSPRSSRHMPLTELVPDQPCLARFLSPLLPPPPAHMAAICGAACHRILPHRGPGVGCGQSPCGGQDLRPQAHPGTPLTHVHTRPLAISATTFCDTHTHTHTLAPSHPLFYVSGWCGSNTEQRHHHCRHRGQL